MDEKDNPEFDEAAVDELFDIVFEEFTDEELSDTNFMVSECARLMSLSKPETLILVKGVRELRSIIAEKTNAQAQLYLVN